MAVCLFVSNPFKSTRLQVSNIDLQNTIAGFKNVITDVIGIHADKQELIYNGGCMEEDERSLLSYGIESNGTIFVFEKIEAAEEEDEGKNKQEFNMSLDELQAILNKAKNPLYKQSVKKLIKNEENLKKAIKHITLDTDTITSAFLRDSDLLLSVIETGNAEKILENYPTLCLVLKSIVSNSSMDLSTRQQLFQDDDEESDFLGIDPAYLAQAELLASTEDSLQQQPSTSQQTPHPTSSTQQNRHQISASDLANALSFASMAQTTASMPGSTGNVENQAQTESALEQMRLMGITDDDLSRRALSMSGGVVEAALNLIFEGTLI